MPVRDFDDGDRHPSLASSNHPIHLISRMTQDTTSANPLTSTDDPPTQPCADVVALGLLWQKIEQMIELQKDLELVLKSAKALEQQALATMTLGTAVFVWPGLIAIASEGEHPISFYPVEGAP